jgi:hypothetical protein
LCHGGPFLADSKLLNDCERSTTMNRFGLLCGFALVLAFAGAAEAQYYTTYYAPTTAYYQPQTVYYAPAPARVAYYSAPVAAPAPAYTTYYAPAAPTYYAAQPVVYYRPVRPIFPRRWYW